MKTANTEQLKILMKKYFQNCLKEGQDLEKGRDRAEEEGGDVKGSKI